MLRIYERNTQKSAIQFIDYVLAKLPFAVEVVQTDNGAEFQGSFHWHLLDRGIGHTYIKPKTPRGLTARWSDPTGSTPRSSTDSSTAGAPGRIRTSGLRIRRPTAVSAVLNLISPGRREAKRA